LLEDELSEQTMQAIAAEMNHSETAFVRPLDGPAARSTHFALRWFTPTVEVPLCGHATLASSAVLFEEVGNAASAIHFQTQSGQLTARKEDSRIALDFPSADLHPSSVGYALLDA